jgi:hypothetical protein
MDLCLKREQLLVIEEITGYLFVDIRSDTKDSVLAPHALLPRFAMPSLWPSSAFPRDPHATQPGLLTTFRSEGVEA